VHSITVSGTRNATSRDASFLNPSSVQPLRTLSPPNHVHNHDEFHLNSATMSSIVDAIITSDAQGAGAPSSSGPTPQARRPPRSSSQPRAPSESVGPHSDYEPFPDDEIVGARGTVKRPRGPAGDIPKLVDVPGETLCESFQTFLETYVSQSLDCNLS
jgi:hypothetical protein